jgi:Uri superfamily endonuclease
VDKASNRELLPVESRWVAAESGQYIYIGSPCKTCQNQRRYTSSGACLECVRAAAKAHNERLRRMLRKGKT